MRTSEFDAIVERRLGLIKRTLITKGREYTLETGDRLNNFRRQAEMQRTTMEKTAWGLVCKQIISVQDMIESGAAFNRAVWDEKLGDIINYCILIEAIEVERACDGS